ncbi:DNA-binding response regulator [Candidatus Roizmanbacteria bacterium RIFOXYB2_FULL_38_10]|uniref:DNA-binding response regulator n=1 Tax=Candidatus Roizmanbacteria bacterium RIFOXYD1_FULL_38_12 TaxID=1802093 RepID=A0A1F7KZP9_9BACT|nr:MAG: DNA-binding response regulator [Candidatus Roizmanbacteria bacterium RIFOXYA2_FULL_38_14]OGK63271.1 MAG: DNA-binding response regulator [Candidatus Roizmanbacteria bacterium RIFOXYA1_FULL_37_12]OGK65117.1 MAG: DNA-binding response regulator [Candidatus Roizmanbacteria bacterium RIFOXYB1_FULL_40_23]OGK68671.1 MAG: DNA-binding response regulator [Candidatus Roizmanbacteria bacterium RIFOXYB2_FULL_38_10]OGK69521.1 MAG: DNA-binding response regulator [Candidatus Roizmanbacteria bacterium RI
MRILLVEDEKRLSHYIKKGLVEEGFAVDQAYDGEEGLYFAKEETYDIIILDVMLPKLSGVEVCKRFRGFKKTTPILMLTARSETEDKILGLESGADDYLTKPFVFAELKARINALLRRSYRQVSNILTIRDLEIDPTKHSVKRDKKDIKLTPKEFAILELLMRRKYEVVTRTQVIEHVWDYNFDSLSNVVDVFIGTLRKKIDRGHKTKLIHTLHGVGYMISDKTPKV